MKVAGVLAHHLETVGLSVRDFSLEKGVSKKTKIGGGGRQKMMRINFGQFSRQNSNLDRHIFDKSLKNP